ncbi:MAG: SLC13 family permease [Gammaproteobacteria bacterium]|nr:SLC13 family permease [Gammaproteobacteria bacterium]
MDFATWLPAGLTPHGAVMLAFTLAMFVIFVLDRFPLASVCLAILVFVPLLFALFPLGTVDGPVTPTDFFLGFGHPALIAICSLMILGQGLVITGALDPAAHVLSNMVGQRPRVALVLVLFASAMASGFINDTPVIVLLVPLLIAAARRAGSQATALLMPVNFAVLIGGMATTIGTSTNLIVVAMARDIGGISLSLFDFYPLVAAAAIPAMLYLWGVAPWLLRSVPRQQESYGEEVFDAELYIPEDAWAADKELREILSRVDYRIQLRGIRRGDKLLSRLPTIRINAGDALLVQDTTENLKELERRLGVKLHDVEVAPDPAEGGAEQAAAQPAEDGGTREEVPHPHGARLVTQFVVTATSPLVGRSVAGARVAETFDLLVVGVRPARPGSTWHRQNVARRQLAEGDVLLVQGDEEAITNAQRRGLGLLLDARYIAPHRERAWTALAALIGVIAISAAGGLSIALTGPAGVLFLLATRTLTWQEVSQSVSVKIILLVTASLALGEALTVTGATTFLASQLVSIADSLSPAATMSLLMLLMGLLTNVVSNNAAAAIGTPISIEIAQQLGAPVEPFVLAVLFGCNLCYLTPMGYQTNLIVMNAAGYRFGDFVRVGTPLFFIMWGMLTWLLILTFGLAT